MRNLKRVLSLALALVMVLGMMVIGTSAATYADAADIDYTEAVDVMSALQVLEGDGTNYNPDAILTRAEATTIIARMLLGKETAAKLVGTGVYTDTVGHWAAGYIDYCDSLGILAGNGDGTFDPNGKLTGVAFAKMLLVALGYDATVEGYVNNKNWATNISSDAFEIGLDVKNVTLADQVSREVAAQMALQALTKTMVKYQTKGTTITVNGVDIVSGASTAEPQKYVEANGYDYTTGANDASAGDTIQFCEKYFDNLSKDATGNNGKDAYGRPGYTWVYGTKPTDKVFVASKPVATYANTFTKDVVDAMTEADANAFTNATVLYNGFTSTGADTVAELYDNKTPINGMTVELYDTNNTPKTIETVVAIEKNYAVVKDVTLTEGQTAGSVTLTIYAWTAQNGHDVTYTDNLKATNDTYDALCGYAKDTALIVGLDKNWHLGDALMSVEAATAVSGKITKMNVANTTNSTTVTVDGKVYPMSQMFIGGKNLTAGEEGTLYLTSEGYAIGWVAKQGPQAQYAYVLGVQQGQAGLFEAAASWYAQLLYTDGTVGIVETTETNGTKAGSVVAYSEGTGRDAGKIVLDATNNKLDQNLGTSITKNAATLDNVTANNGTVYVVEVITNGKPAYTVYTGVTNVPALSVNTYQDQTPDGEIAGVLNATGTAWSYVFVKDANVPTTTTATNVAYLSANSTLIKEVVGNKTLTYYVWDAVINGQITTVKVAATVAQNGSHSAAQGVNAGLCSVLTYNDDGLLSASTTMQDNNDAGIDVFTNLEGTKAGKDGVIALDTEGTETNYIYNDSTVVYKVAANGAISTSSIGAIKVDTNDTVDGYTTKDVLTMVVITEVANLQA